MPVALSPRQGLPAGVAIAAPATFPGVAVIAGDIRRHPVTPDLLSQIKHLTALPRPVGNREPPVPVFDQAVSHGRAPDILDENAIRQPLLHVPIARAKPTGAVPLYFHRNRLVRKRVDIIRLPGQPEAVRG